MTQKINWFHQAHIWMESSSENIFRPEIEDYVDLLLNRILPLFADPDEDQERASEVMLFSGEWGPDDDYASVMEAAYHHGIERGIMLMEMRTVFLATSVAGLFHLFEKQVCRHLRREFRNFQLSHKNGKPLAIGSWVEASDLIEQFCCGHEVKDRTLLEAMNDPDLQELKEVANAVKHGEGRATRALREMNAIVISADRVEKDWTTGEFSVLSVPLSIHVEDVLRYKEAVLAFWRVRERFAEK